MNRALLAGGVIAAACLTANQGLAQTPAAPAKDKDATVSNVTVNGARRQVETSVDRRSYSVANDLQGKTGAIADVLRNIPSVQVDVEGNVTLRGDGNVTILVDGKPSALLSRETLAQALQSMPADQVDRIEVMTNPSAEFRADGTAGIINLVMKKAKGAGKTGSLRLNGVSTGSGSASVTHGFNSDKLSVIDSVSVRHDRRTQASDYEHEQADPAGGMARRDETFDGKSEMDGVQGRVSADYDLSAKTRLNATLSGAWQDGVQTFNDELILTSGAGAVRTTDRLSTLDQGAKNAQLDLSLRRKEDARELSLRASYGIQSNFVDRLDLTAATPAPANPFAAADRGIHAQRASLSADYQDKLKSGLQLKTGYLLEYNDGVLDQVIGSGPTATGIATDPAQSFVFALDETHHQAYATLQGKAGPVTVLGGLRAEAVKVNMDVRSLGTHAEQDYTRLYPSLHLSYPLGEGRNLTASYSRRVSRPGPFDLIPFRAIGGINSYNEGNPNLKPQETHSFEAGFERRKGSASLLATAYYRQSDNAFSTIITDLGNGFFLQQRTNLGHQTNAGLELVLSDKLSPKLTYNLSVNGYQTDISTPLGLGGYSERSSFASYGRINLNWQASAKDFIQLNVFANGKQLLPQGYASPSVSGNIGWRRTLTDKVSMMLVVQDPFGTLKNELVLDQGGVKDRRTSRQDARVVSLTLVWNFAGKPKADNSFDFAPGGAASAVP